MEKHNQYFEGILQLRNADNEVLDFVLNLIEKRDSALLSKKEKVTNGFDIYLASQSFLQHIGKQLKKHFHGELKISARLYTRSKITAKDVYRVTVLFRMSNIQKDDMITFKGDKIKIVWIGKKILAKELETGRKLTLNFKDL